MAYEFECKRDPLPCSAPSCICPRKEVKRKLPKANYKPHCDIKKAFAESLRK